MKPQASIVNQIPFLRFSLAFLSGIVVRYMTGKISDYFLIPVIFFSILLFFLHPRSKKSYRLNRLYGILVFLLFISAGFGYSHFYLKNMFCDTVPLKGTYTGVIIEKSPSSNNKNKYIVQLESAAAEDSVKFINEKIQLYSSDSISNKKLEPGMRILFDGTLYEISNNNNPGEFDYKQYLNREGIRYQMSVKKEMAFAESGNFNIKVTALKIRSRLLRLYKNAGIEGDEFAVLSALTLGDKNYLTSELKSSFSASGAMHVLAVSGLHVGIIFFILNFLLTPLNRNKRLLKIKLFLLVGALWFYAFLTGLSPSVMRSCTMFSFIVIGENLNKRTNIYNTLAASAFLLMLINPLIIFGAGFQLSYIAVISIVFFQPRLAALVAVKNRILKYVWDLFTVSVAVQIGTAPISIFYFHQFPVYFWLSNFIVIPGAALILYNSALFLVLSFSPLISSWIAVVLKSIVWFVNYSVKSIEHLPDSVIGSLKISSVTMMLIYLIVISFTLFMFYKRGKYLIAFLSILLLTLFINMVEEIHNNTQQIIIIYNNYTEPLISYIDGKHHYYFCLKNKISPFSVEILKNSSIEYRTGKAESMTNNILTNCSFTPNYLDITGFRILLTDRNFDSNSSDNTYDLVYCPAKASVVYKPRNNLKIKSKMSGILKTKDQSNQNQVYNLKNDGAIMFLLQ